jgi:hypothetical protein
MIQYSNSHLRLSLEALTNLLAALLTRLCTTVNTLRALRCAACAAVGGSTTDE